MQPGYETDHWRLMIYDRAVGQAHQLDRELRSQSRSLRVDAGQPQRFISMRKYKAEMPVYSIAATPRQHAEGDHRATASMSEFDLSRDGQTLAFTRTSLTMPPEIFTAEVRTEPICSKLPRTMPRCLPSSI